MSLKINQIDIQSNNEFCSVLLTHSDESNVIIISRPFDGDDNYIEWNDQANSVYGGMESATLNGNDFTIHLSEKGKLYFGIPEVNMGINLTKEVYNLFVDCAKDIFKDNFIVTDKTIAFTNKPKSEYEKIYYVNLSNKNLKLPPAELSSYVNLEKLFMLNNPQLDVEATFDILKKLPGIKKLHITIHGQIPSSISSLIALEELHIEGTPDLSTLPPDIRNLKNLKYIYLQSENEIHLPNQFSDMESLEWLHIRSYKWSLPTDFFKLTKLKSLDLYNCEITELPDEMYRMENLESIAFGYNELRNYDNILQALRKVSSLRTLEINIVGPVNNLGMCTQIEHLTINSDYSIEDVLTLDDTFCLLQNLKTLHFNQCNILELPDCIFELTGLLDLSFEDCQFTQIPARISQLKGLETLIISNCEHLESLPAELFRLTSLKSLQLYELPKLRSLPAELEALINLTDIQIPEYEEIENIPSHWLKLLK